MPAALTICPMLSDGWTRGSRWWPPFAVSAVAVLGALGFLAFVAASDRRETSAANSPATDGSARGSPRATVTPPALRYEGVLPAGLGPSRYVAADASHGADLSFTPTFGGEGAPVAFWVVVASPHAGIDALTRAQLQTLFAKTSTLAEAGGLGGRPELLATAEDATTAQRIFPGVLIRQVESTLALRNELNDPSAPPALALVPLGEVRPWMSAVAIDGIDPVRGRGDIASWPYVERVRVTGLTPAGVAAVTGIVDAIAPKLPSITTVVATGDILMSRCSLTQIRATGDWAAALRGPVAEYLAAADLALGSLDGSIQDIGAPHGCVETTNLTSPPQVIEALTVAGIDGVTVATNHTLDCGQAFCGSKALLRTIELLHGAGIKTAGGGANLEAALAPAIYEVNGIRFGVLAFDDVAAEDLQATDGEAGTAPLDDSYADEQSTPPREPAFYKPASMLGVTRLQERIRKLKQEVDVVIVQIQSGTEDTHDPSPRSVKGLRAAAEAGADLVVGNQAHWVQAAEMRGDTFVAYALGNFVFDQRWTPEHTQGYLLEATFWGKQLANVRLVPYQIADQYRPEFVTGATRAKILRDVFEAAERLPGEP